MTTTHSCDMENGTVDLEALANSPYDLPDPQIKHTSATFMALCQKYSADATKIRITPKYVKDADGDVVSFAYDLTVEFR